MPTVSRFTTAEASEDCLFQIRELFFTAFDERFTESDWEHVLGGWHVVISEGGVVVSHAAIVERTLVVGDRSSRTGYVEGVATHPSRQRMGLGSQVMDEVAQLLKSEHEMGALSTSVRGFYEPLGWERWLGPTYVQYGSQLVRTEGEDDGVMVLTFGSSRDIDLTASISCQSRVGDDW